MNKSISILFFTSDDPLKKFVGTVCSIRLNKLQNDHELARWQLKYLNWNYQKNVASLPLDKGYDYFRVLIRSNIKPIGWISINNNSTGEIPYADLKQIIKQQLGTSIIKQALIGLHNIQKPNIAAEGISVVVCTRNRTAQLASCLNTLFHLKYPKFEILVIDNAPANDDTLKLTANLPVRYIREDCPGLDWARNRGIAEAQYDIIAFTDDDVRVDIFWLEAISKAFTNPEVMGVSGFVAAAELETPAQHVFELNYGGMGHGFNKRFIKKDRLTEKQLLWASSFGIGANMAFRKKVFEKIGGFETALDVGTPSHGGGDVAFFHRIVANGNLFVYEPSMLIWHYHRREYTALRQQIFDNGRSFGCYLIDCFCKKTVSRFAIIHFFFTEWLLKWNLKNLFRLKTNIPRKLSIAELTGMLTSPFAYWKTKRRDRRMKYDAGSRK